MAERIDEPESEQETDAVLEQASPAAVALALGRAGRDGGGAYDEDARTFLREQTGLLRLQKEHLHEQRELQLAHLRVRRWKDRLSIALQALGAAIGAAVVIGLGLMIWQAQEDHGLVVEAFSVPPDLAQRGLTGQVAASRLMDQLAQLQAKTDSARAASTYANNWGDDIKVEIPDTGVSIGELSRYLRRWLGHQTVISGEVVRTGTGLSITARLGADGGESFEGPEGDLDMLFQQAARAVYRRTQPYRYGVLLEETGDLKGAVPVFEALLADRDPNERRWAALGLANVDLYSSRVQQAENAYEAIDARDPGFIMGVSNIEGGSTTLDHEQRELEAARRTLLLLPNGVNAQITPISAQSLSGQAKSAIAELQGDFQQGARTEAQSASEPDYGGSRATALLTEAADLGLDHQTAAARAVLAVDHPPAGVLATYVGAFNAQVLAGREVVDAAAGDWAGAVADGVQAQQLASGSSDPFIRYQIDRQVLPWLAYARARTGDPAGADALIAQTPLDSDTALRFHGKVAAAKGDWAGAGRWFAMAVRQAPAIPFAYTDWGEMLLAKGDVDAAIAKLKVAHEKGPHYADALERWGEALMKQGDYAGAAARFAEADKYAPNWARNRQLWRQAQARAQSHG